MASQLQQVVQDLDNLAHADRWQKFFHLARLRAIGDCDLGVCSLTMKQGMKQSFLSRF